MQIVRAISAVTVLVVVALHSTKLLGVIRLSDVMSVDEQKKTGVSQLNETQKQELERWMNNTFILKTSQDTTSLSLQQNMQNGAQLVLSDGSVYEVAPSDRAKTTLWLTPITIQVSSSGDPQFPALLTNTLTGVSVKAKPVTPSKS